MTITQLQSQPQLVTRSIEPDWDSARWAELPDDGNLYEVIDGVLYTSRSPRAYHQWVVKCLLRCVGLPAEDREIAYAYFAPMGVFMPGCDPVQPDFLLIRPERISIIVNGEVHGVPDLIAEVLSPSNPALDTRIKRSAYAKAGVPEYWILRPATRDVLVCWQPDAIDGDYKMTRVVRSDELLESVTFPIQVLVDDLYVGSPETAM